MLLYLSGPITGILDNNRIAFKEGTIKLADAGHFVINPIDNWHGRKDVPRHLCMRVDLMQVLAAEGVAVLDGWEKSKGATCEVMVAKEIGIPVKTVDEWITI